MLRLERTHLGYHPSYSRVVVYPKLNIVNPNQ